MTQPAPDISAEDIKRLARLARLEVDDPRAEQMAPEISGILRHVAKVGELDLRDVEPLASPGTEGARLDDDEPGSTLDPRSALALSPDAAPPFLKVPPVLGSGGAASDDNPRS